MISSNDKKLLTEAGREYILEATVNSKILKDKLTFKEQVLLCNQVKNLKYEEVISLLVTEDIRSFEGKFSKFLKYSVAAIAGGVFGGFTAGAPPVAMFALYLYRKLTDTCERSCLAKIPFSSKRKICKYECQLAAAKKMANEIRSNISKCSQFTYANKCEKKLQGEYIKWAKRVQMLIVKLNRAKAGEDEKLRKEREKEYAKKAKAINASFELPKKEIIKFISENENLRHSLSFKEHLKLYQTCQYIQEEKKDEVGHFEVDPKKEKMARMALYLGGMVFMPIPFFDEITNYLVKKYSLACAGKCLINSKLPKNVCYNQCAYLGAQYAVKTLNSQLSKCNKSKKPLKCKEKIYDLLEDWKQREVERKIKFESSLKNEIRKAKEKNLKAQQRGK